jgi:pimeloyl-ACP methyl ester carboxylesterase
MTGAFNIEVGRARLAGERGGTGRAVVFLHAGVADRRMWREQVAALGSVREAAAYDRRGFGESTSPDEPFSHVGDLRELLDGLGIETTTLVGCSQGGRIAIDFALASPERVCALVLAAPAVSGAPKPEDFPPQVQERVAALEAAEAAGDLERVNEIEVNLWLDGPGEPEGRVRGAVRELVLDMNRIALGNPELTREIDPPSAQGRLSELGCPTFVIWGALDFPHLRQRCRELVSAVPGAKGEEMPGVAHLPNLERPGPFNQLLVQFLGQQAK